MPDVNRNYLVTFSPHVRDPLTTDKLMMLVVYALLPAVLVSVYHYGYYALQTYVVTILSAYFWEWLHQKLSKRASTLSDNSCLVTALLLAMNLPPAAPVWLAVVGSYIAIIVAKMIFGGLGQNPFNPALVGRIFLLIAFPVQMTAWTAPHVITDGFLYDAVSSATPLGAAKTELLAKGTIVSEHLASLSGGAFGSIGGSLGEDSAIALLLGGLFLMYRRIISWHIPFTYLASFLLVVVPYWMLHPDMTLSPSAHLVSGGLMLGVFFMATDYSTSPMTTRGKIVFGIGCGVLTAVIRLFGSYPEGVGFAILIMNAMVPLIDTYLRPKSFGEA